jgi:hypothetical protein
MLERLETSAHSAFLEIRPSQQGLAQLERADDLIAKKTQIAHTFKREAKIRRRRKGEIANAGFSG